jgi:hypothetical protein
MLGVGVWCVEVDQVYPRLGVGGLVHGVSRICIKLIVAMAMATSIRLITTALSVSRVSPTLIRNVLIMSTPLYLFANSCILGV